MQKHSDLLHHNLEQLSTKLFQLFIDYQISDSNSSEFSSWLNSNDDFDDESHRWKNQKDTDFIRQIFCRETTIAIFCKLYIIKMINQKLNLELENWHNFNDVLNNYDRFFSEFFTEKYYSWPNFIMTQQNFGSLLFSIYADIKYENEFDIYLEKIYFNSVDIQFRKESGTFYTDHVIVDYILEKIHYTINNDSIPNRKILDPACGSGSFLFKALTVFCSLCKKTNYSTKNFLTLIENGAISGIDIKPLAVVMSKTTFINSILNYYENILQISSKPIKIPIYQMDFLLNNLNSLVGIKSHFDYVVGNPPYLRIQRVYPKSKRLEYIKEFDSAVGRFDIYVLFIEKGIKILNPNGSLGFIVSNKFMTTNSGVGIREVIHNSSTILHLLDLNDTDLMNAMVLPCVLILKKTKSKTNLFHYLHVKRIRRTNSNQINNLFQHMLKIPTDGFFQEAMIKGKHGNVAIQISSMLTDLALEKSSDPWYFMKLDDKNIIEKIDSKKTHILGDLATISVGIKTTADPVFCEKLTASFIKEKKLDKSLVFKMLRGINVQKWIINWKGETSGKETHILYPYKKQGSKVVPVNLDDYPSVKQYFEEPTNKNILDSRTYVKEAGRQWYEIWVHLDPDSFKKTKIVTPDISNINRFALDLDGFFPGGSVFTITVDQNLDFNKYMLGLLNSELLEYYHKQNNSTSIYSGRYRYTSTYLKKLPIISYKKLCMSLSKKVQSKLQNIAKDDPLMINRIKITDDELIIGDIVKLKATKSDVSIMYKFFLSMIIIELVTRIISNYDHIQEYEKIINECVYGIYEITSNEQKIIQQKLAS